MHYDMTFVETKRVLIIAGLGLWLFVTFTLFYRNEDTETPANVQKIQQSDWHTVEVDGHEINHNWEEMMQVRRQTVSEMCQKFNLTNTDIQIHKKSEYILCVNQFKVRKWNELSSLDTCFSVISYLQLCYCPNAKVGSTTWMRRFMVHIT